MVTGVIVTGMAATLTSITTTTLTGIIISTAITLTTGQDRVIDRDRAVAIDGSITHHIAVTRLMEIEGLRTDLVAGHKDNDLVGVKAPRVIDQAGVRVLEVTDQVAEAQGISEVTVRAGEAVSPAIDRVAAERPTDPAAERATDRLAERAPGQVVGRVAGREAALAHGPARGRPDQTRWVTAQCPRAQGEEEVAPLVVVVAADTAGDLPAPAAVAAAAAWAAAG